MTSIIKQSRLVATHPGLWRAAVLEKEWWLCCCLLAAVAQVRVFKHVFNRMGRFQRWGPTFMGLSLIPFLPYMFDEPVSE